jgi:AraC-like DNA-binding protein
MKKSPPPRFRNAGRKPERTFTSTTTPIAGVIKHMHVSLERVGTWSHPAGYNHPPRIDSHSVLICVETGTAMMRIGPDIFKVGPGDILFLPRLVSLHYRVGKGAPFLHHAIMFTMENEEGVHIENLNLVPTCTRLEPRKEILDDFAALSKRMSDTHPSAYFECLGIFFNLLSRMCKKGQDRSPEGSIKVNKAHEALHVIEEKYSGHLTVEEIARQISITPEYLSTVFRDTFGVTPKTQIRNFRLQRAGDMLWTTDLSVKEIAFAVGYDSVNTFNRAFRKLFKEAPVDFRHHHTVASVSGPKMTYRKMKE